MQIPKKPWTKLGKKIESAIRKAMYDFSLLENVSKLAVALSGGKDSLTLLFMLHELNGRGLLPFSLTAIHVAGSFSCGCSLAPALLENICSALQIPLIIRPMPEHIKISDCYSCSRIRRKILFSAAKELGISHIAFGHHKDDAAQTTLMNLFHKGEFAGLQPKITMHAYDITIIRPLIYVREDEISSFATLYGYKRITCQCPLGKDSVRKKTQELLHDIEKFFPNAMENVAQATLQYGSDKALIES